MKTVRAKFRCSHVTEERYPGQKQTKVMLYPVDSGPFWEATPGGRLEIDIANAAAAAFFEPGQEYFLDFTAADETE